MAKLICDFQLVELGTTKAIITAGGMVQVCKTGLPDKAVVYDNAGVAMANPVPLTRGHIRFQVDDTNATVDLYVMAPGGQFVEFLGVRVNSLIEGLVDTSRREQLARVPYSATDSTAATEKDTGFDLPIGALVSPFQAVVVTRIDATETIDYGILSTETGDADGFGALVPVGVLGTIALKSAATATRGALIGAGTLDRGYAVLSTGVSLSYTLTAGSDTAGGFLEIPYLLAA